MMKSKPICLIIILITVITTSCSVKKITKSGAYRVVEANEFTALLTTENVNIIDVRTKGEFKKGHIKDAINISYFSGKFLKLVKQQHLDTSKLTLIYCQTQHRSPIVAKKLHKIGFNKIVDLEKGMNVWSKQGFPTVKDTLN